MAKCNEKKEVCGNFSTQNIRNLKERDFDWKLYCKAWINIPVECVEWKK